MDGDTIPDFAAVVTEAPEPGPPTGIGSAPRVAAFSGKNGQVIWQASALEWGHGSSMGSGIGWSYRLPLLDWTDVDGDGRAEILAVQPGMDQVARVALLAGRDGALRWKIPVVKAGFAPQPCPGQRPWADVNRDGVRDLAMWTPMGPAQTGGPRCALNVFDGRTGQPLWPEETLAVENESFLVWPEPAVGDFNADGVTEVLATVHHGFDRQRGRYSCDLIALDGRTGNTLWIWTWEAGFPEVWPPVFVGTEGDQPSLVCLGVRQLEFTGILVLDSRGALRQRIPLRLANHDFNGARLVWRKLDPDEQGAEAVVFLNNDRLCAAGGPELQTLWQWAGLSSKVDIIDAQAGASGQPSPLVLWSGRSVFGFSAASGQPEWRCEVREEPRWGTSDPPTVHLLAGASSSSLPLQASSPARPQLSAKRRPGPPHGRAVSPWMHRAGESSWLTPSPAPSAARGRG